MKSRGIRFGAAGLAAIVSVFVLAGAGLAQERPVRITSPADGDTVMEGQPLIITVSADPSVRFVTVFAWHPLPNVRPVGPNQFEIDIPKTVPPGRYQLTAFGATTTDVESEPVSIHVERDDPAIALKVPPVFSFVSSGAPMPLYVIATFADGSTLDVTHSLRTSFQSKNTQVVTIDDQGRATACGPGQTTIVVSYGSVQASVLILGPKTRLSYDESANVYAVGKNHDPGAGETPGLPASEFDITAVLGVVKPGNRIRIAGSGFGSEQGIGSVTIAAVSAQVVKWSSTEITVAVPEFSVSGKITRIVIRQNDVSEDFPLVLP
jgi:hypothetical protein